MDRKDKIFGDGELELLEKRIKGDKSDPNGLWARKVKPKVIDLLKWFKRRRELRKLVEVKK